MDAPSPWAFGDELGPGNGARDSVAFFGAPKDFAERNFTLSEYDGAARRCSRSPAAAFMIRQTRSSNRQGKRVPGRCVDSASSTPRTGPFFCVAANSPFVSLREPSTCQKVRPRNASQTAMRGPLWEERSSLTPPTSRPVPRSPTTWPHPLLLLQLAHPAVRLHRKRRLHLLSFRRQ
jgi:hypothetical protein